MGMVLVHGGGHAGSCWDRVVPHIDEDVVAVDLPGRGSNPADLRRVTSADGVETVVTAVEQMGEDVLLVGHSMAGILIPRVMARVGDRLRGVVFVSCMVPPDGGTVVDGLTGVEVIERSDIDLSATPGPGVDTEPQVLDPALARELFCTDMDDETADYELSLMVPEATGVIHEPIDTSGRLLPIPTTWIRLLRDTILSPEIQTAAAARIPDTSVIDLDTGHMAMITQPRELAALLNDL